MQYITASEGSQTLSIMQFKMAYIYKTKQRANDVKIE